MTKYRVSRRNRPKGSRVNRRTKRRVKRSSVKGKGSVKGKRYNKNSRTMFKKRAGMRAESGIKKQRRSHREVIRKLNPDEEGAMNIDDVDKRKRKKLQGKANILNKYLDDCIRDHHKPRPEVKKHLNKIKLLLQSFEEKEMDEALETLDGLDPADLPSMDLEGDLDF